MHAANLHYTLNESQWTTTWKKLVKLAEQPGKSLEQAHIFCLAHVLRRPVIVYGVKYVHNSTGEVLDYARFEGEMFACKLKRHFKNEVTSSAVF